MLYRTHQHSISQPIYAYIANICIYGCGFHIYNISGKNDYKAQNLVQSKSDPHLVKMSERVRES